jgi:protein-S-isoprenylcysteine O-methyltransferase Ste14
MYYFLIFLILGFGSNLASAFTTTYSEKLGKQTGTFITILLRDILGIPVWAIGFLLAIKESSGLLYHSSLFSQIAGWLVIIAGAVVIIIALISIRTKAAAPSVDDSLIKTGIYSLVRHPIHSGTFLEFFGLFILWPSLTVGISCCLGFTWILIQSGFEEKDLIRRIPEYKEYMKKVSRFIPKSRVKL